MDFDFDHLDEIEEQKSSTVSPDEIEKTSSTVSHISSNAKAPAAGPASYQTEKTNGPYQKENMIGEVWEVIGGVDKGGIVVRRGAPLVSPEMPKRLATGALVEVLEVEGDRLKYHRLTGEGPDVGWVSIRANGKEIMVKTTQEPPYVDKKPSSPKVGSPVKPASPKAPEPAKEPAKAAALAKAPTPTKLPEPAKVPEPAKTPEPVKAAAKPTVVQAKAPEPSKAPAPEPSQPKSPAPEPPQPKVPEPIKVATPKVDVPEPSATQPTAAPRELSQVTEEKGGNSMNLAIIGGVALMAVVVLGIVMSKKK